MTIEHWLTIVAIIAASITTLAAPILADFVKSRISRPKPTPEPNQPKNMIQRVGGWVVRISTSPWLYSFFLVLNVFILRWELRHVAVVIKRDDVLAISITMGAIYFNFTQAAARLTERSVLSIEKRSLVQAEVSLRIGEILLDLRKQLNGIQEAINLREKPDVLKADQVPQPAKLSFPAQPVNPKPEKAIGDNAEIVEPKKEYGG